jgi:hypothetical protein
MDVDLHERELREDGYTVLKGIIPKDNILKYKDIIQSRRYSEDRDDDRLFLNNKTLFHLGINDPKFKGLVGILEETDLNDFLAYLMDGEMVYCHQFDIHVGQNSESNWHDDCLGYIPCEYEKDYRVYRVAIFLQENKDGNISLKNGSHKMLNNGSFDTLKVELGDVVVFDARTQYRNVFYKALDENVNRITMLMTVGFNNEFTKLHYDAMIKKLEEKTSGKYNLSDDVRLTVESNEYIYEMGNEEEDI